MEIQLGYEIINSYKRLSYTPWYALAEYVDNSTQAYYNNKVALDEIYSVSADPKDQNLRVEIEYDSSFPEGLITIRDNSVGMSYEELQRSIVIGRPPVISTGRSKYGLGMKTASFWLGDYWSIKTKKLGETTEHFIGLDASKISSGNTELDYSSKEGIDSSMHYTIIKIHKLHRNFYGKTIDKIKRYLRSMYRKDISNNILTLIWQGEELNWSNQDIFDRLIKEGDEPLIRNIDFTVDNKRVTGWAGVLEKGSRADAGFSLIQSNRVIKGWPSNYKPETLFGPQEGGSNDLVNQRLIGELYVDGFDVSHTKDEILFNNDEQETVEALLLEQCGDLRTLALTYRKNIADQRYVPNLDFRIAVTDMEEEIKSDYVQTFLEVFEIPDEEIIKGSNETVIKSVQERLPPSFDIFIGRLRVELYIVEDMSPYEPYVLIQSTSYVDRVIVVINKAHPYWLQLKTSNEILQFVRQCVYDGVSEWKAFSVTHKLDPDTIKLIKDNLLRVPYKMD